MEKVKNTLQKSERLTSRTSITQVYNKGKHLNAFPFKIVWIEEFDTEFGVKVVFSVPKRKFKRAVDRNQIKRFMREAYRLNKHDCINELKTHKKRISLFLVYLGKEIPTYEVSEDKIILLLNRLTKEVTSK